MNFQIHLPLTLACRILSDLVDIKVKPEPLLTIFSCNVISKDIIWGNITANFSDHLSKFLRSHQTPLPIHPPINLMFLKGSSQFLTRKVFSWITVP